MSLGNSWSNANVNTGTQTFKKVRATIYDGMANLYEADGTVVATMQNPVVEGYDSNSATWSNGSETWQVTKAGCGCRGE